MKIVDDSEKIKKMLKDYDPSLVGYRTIPAPNFSNKKLVAYLQTALSVNQDINKKTQAILLASDEINEENDIQKYSVCQNGCAYCCKIHVSVTTMEANLIKEYTGKTLINPPHISNNSDGENYEYCPFLDKDKANCSIYSVRPLHCRCFHTLDHYKYCQATNIHHLILTVYSDEKLKILHGLLLQGSNNYYTDIRNWFE